MFEIGFDSVIRGWCSVCLEGVVAVVGEYGLFFASWRNLLVI